MMITSHSTLKDTNQTNARDLVELAGLQAYQFHVKRTYIDVNRKKFKIVDTNYDKSGNVN